eukprot:scaffold2044_cov305-Pavlova_lutheri.AAC.10
MVNGLRTSPPPCILSFRRACSTPALSLMDARLRKRSGAPAGADCTPLSSSATSRTHLRSTAPLAASLYPFLNIPGTVGSMRYSSCISGADSMFFLSRTFSSSILDNAPGMLAPATTSNPSFNQKGW